MLKLNFDTGAISKSALSLQEVIEGAVRPAAQAAAQVLYEEVQERAGRVEYKGLLRQSIYQKYVQEASIEGRTARYHISWNKGRGVATPKANHGHLIEYGWIQRYANYIGSDGQWHTAIRPEMKGKPKPPRRAAQSVKDAYYVLRKGGPVQHPPRSFLRASYDAKVNEALAAAKKEFEERILKAFI